MTDETGLQHSGRASPEDILAEIEAIEAPAEKSEPAPRPLAPAPNSNLRFKSAIDAWFKRKVIYDANPNTFEALLAQRIQEKNRAVWRAEHAERIRKDEGREVREYERNQTPDRRKIKKAEKSKAERARRLARSTPEQIEAEKQAARDRAKASRVKVAGRADAEAEAEQEAVRNLPTFGMM